MPHTEIVGVAKPPSSNLYSMIDPNLIYATQSGAGVKIRNIWKGGTYHKASRIPSVYPSTPHPEIVGVAKPPSTNLYSTSDINLIYPPPQSGAGVKIRNIRGWMGRKTVYAGSFLVKIEWPVRFISSGECRPNSVRPPAQESGNLWSADFQGIYSFNLTPWNISVHFKHVTGSRIEPIRTVTQVLMLLNK
ncbi:hypothetical protein CEXT_609881 [Caerostris extrusa]|uniref:Uncharacterized protein n=1 Tax=Caerostris extrusa TaxID=172846 RepID=A0AAV4NWD6_CAEEX|nr:hypothetical protein CEXT_609881 [Caerostris extrusa]